MTLTLHRYYGDKIMEHDMVGSHDTYGVDEKRIQSLVGKPEVKELLGRHMRTGENNIKMDLQQLRWRSRNESNWLRTGTGGGLF